MTTSPTFPPPRTSITDFGIIELHIDSFPVPAPRPSIRYLGNMEVEIELGHKVYLLAPTERPWARLRAAAFGAVVGAVIVALLVH